MCYFLSTIEFNLHNDRSAIFKNRLNFFLFNVGDVVAIVFKKSGYYFLFEGLCLAMRNKNFMSPNTSFILCNVLAGVVVEISISYYYHLTFIFRTINSRFNLVTARRSKLHYLRNKLTRGSRAF